jgi:hypothetical protein
MLTESSARAPLHGSQKFPPGCAKLTCAANSAEEACCFRQNDAVKKSGKPVMESGTGHHWRLLAAVFLGSPVTEPVSRPHEVVIDAMPPVRQQRGSEKKAGSVHPGRMLPGTGLTAIRVQCESPEPS